jgi:hypothetical protein
MSGDPTTDPLTQRAWDKLIEYVDLGIEQSFEDEEDEALDVRVYELLDAIQRLRYNYMAMTMVMPTRQNL